jgi:hypothetical protein
VTIIQSGIRRRDGVARNLSHRRVGREPGYYTSACARQERQHAMTETDTNLVLEHLKIIRAQTSGFGDKVDSLQQDFRNFRRDLRGIQAMQDQDHEDIQRLKDRVSRIETHLEMAS